MKTPEQALQEWATDEIIFHCGNDKRKFTRANFTFLIDIMRQEEYNSMTFFFPIFDALGQEWHVPHTSFINADQLKDVRKVLAKHRSKRDILVPRMAIQFDSLTEIEKWAEGKIESRIQVYVPPVDSWMKPL